MALIIQNIVVCTMLAIAVPLVIKEFVKTLQILLEPEEIDMGK